MTTTDDLVDRIRSAPRGPRVAAAFDYDGTLISGYSAAAFLEHRLKSGDMGPAELARTALAARRGIADDAAFAAFFAFSLAAWRDVEEAELEALGNTLFKGQIAATLHHEVLPLVEAHRELGHTLILASSAMRFQTEPMAAALDIEHVLNTAVEVVDGRLTGKVAGAPLWGAAKAQAVRALAAELDVDLAQSFAYSNGREDVPLLEAVGYPAAVEPDADLYAEARLRGWPVLRCSAGPPSIPGVKDLARTAAFYGGFLGTLGAGIGVGLLRRSRSTVLDIALGPGTDLSLALPGVDVDVLQGAEHLWSARPCVFVFNHTSKMDAFIAMKLLRENFTGVAKAQAKNVPVFGQLFQFAGMAFVDRSDHTQARKALAPVVERLREGTSVVVSPEGTRTPTPRLGPFKKGPFHIAMQAGVPVVPMVFRGVDRVQTRGGQIIRAGTVEVVVLPPVATRAWRPETAGDHAGEVRDLMLAAQR
jgi:putative phosphoserine phosphatase/1-acylglycerol-3-phosphate O-acyltransferase